VLDLLGGLEAFVGRHGLPLNSHHREKMLTGSSRSIQGHSGLE
jgi:hypothetical protein